MIDSRTNMSNALTKVEVDLGHMWSCLGEAEKASFWRFSVKDVLQIKVPSSQKRPPTRDPIYDGLCNAIKALERSGLNKPKETLLPSAARRISAEDLSKGVSRFRERLFDSADAHAYVVFSLCRWVQSSKLATLLRVLDTLGCQHNEFGVLVGNIPVVSSDFAMSTLLAEVEKYSPQDLALTCGALILNHSTWSYLAEVFFTLKALPHKQVLTAAEESISPEITEVLVMPKLRAATLLNQEPTAQKYPIALTTGNTSEQLDTGEKSSSQNKPSPKLELTLVASLRAELQELRRKLDQAIASIERDEVPDPAETVYVWQSLNTKFVEFSSELKIVSRRLIDTEYAIELTTILKSSRAIVERATKIKHVSEIGFSGLQTILSACDKLLENLESGNIDSIKQESDPLSALLRLIEEPEAFDDDAAEKISETIRTRFGNAVITAVLRGKLFVGERSEKISVPDESLLDKTPGILNVAQAELPIIIETENFETLSGDPTNLTGQVLREATVLGIEQPIEGQPEHVDDFLAVNVEATALLDVGPIENAVEVPFHPYADLLPVEKIERVGEVPVASPLESQQVAAQSHEKSPDTKSVELCNIDFESFRKLYWLNEHGKVSRAPWTDATFALALLENTDSAWERAEFGIAYLFARAASLLGLQSKLEPSELAFLEKLFDQPKNLSAARFQGRVARIRDLANSDSSSISVGISLILEAVSPTYPFSLSSGEISYLVDRANYSDPTLKLLITFLLNGWAAAIDPIDILRTSIHQAAQASPSVLAEGLNSAQEGLRNEIAAQWSAAGGRLRHTHSRKAWTEFVRLQVGPLRDELAPQGRLPFTPKWSIAIAREKISQLGKTFQRIMDAGAVKHQDRVAAMHAAEQIVASVERVVEAMQRQTAASRTRNATFAGIEPDVVMRLLTEQSTSSLDNLCTRVLRCILLEERSTGTLALAAGYLVTQPNLIRTLSMASIAEATLTDGIFVSKIQYPESAAALLLDWSKQALASWSDYEQLLLAIRNAAADEDRWDILAALSPTDALQAHERTLLHRRALSLGDEAYELARRLERTWGACDEMLAPNSGSLKLLVDDASDRTANGSVESPIEDSVLLHDWISRVLAAAEAARDAAVDKHIASASLVSSATAEKVTNFFSEGNYRAAVALIHGGDATQSGPDIQARRTLWRQDAISRYSNPRHALANDLRGTNTEQGGLANLWSQGDLGDAGYKDTLRRFLYQVISGEAGKSQAENQRRFPVKLSELREHRDKKTIIHCAAVREYFRKARINPTFLPQLADFQQIVLTSSASLSSNSANFLDGCSKAAALEGPGTLVVFLEPGISEGRRDELSSGLRRRGVPAAILDDIDICRLCAVDCELDAHNFIPFLEIVLEQLDLVVVSPFSSLDGQHVRIETYIGRVQAAHQIAMGWSFTRVFSGRKLGKSAFLRHVANTYNGERLPSGNRLNVFFITIAGGESEVWVVNTIIDEMTERFTLSELESSMKLPPAERFSRYMKRFMQARPNDNVLLVLDEADSFVEGQLASYNEDREGSLSFRMMKELASQVDTGHMPRVRIVFSGYRVTNTRGGVWANAGDVLVLQPLTEDEAVQFLRGMFARVGVDLGDHAPFIARRCGFQPAVLIRFGESLLKRLKRVSNGRRETILVNLEEVRATMNEQSVLDEIRTVVNNNFQGNRIGAAIFGATLLALKELQPGMALAEGPAQVLEQLIRIDTNLDWLERLGSQPIAHIERQLQDFIERELLTVADAPRFGVREYRLKFPHFLPVLTQQADVAIEVSQQIQLIRAGTTEKRMIECVLPESALDVVRYWFHQPSASDCAVVVVASQWAAALLDEKCGLPDRLGLNRHSYVRNPSSEALGAHITQGTRLFGGVDPKTWNSFLSSAPTRPLVVIGGIDLLRLAKDHVLSGGDTPIDVVALGRIPDSTLSWWFESVRSLHFKTLNAVAQISKATNGIPILVSYFDRLLTHAPATDVTHSDLESAFEKFDTNLSEYARDLVHGTSAVRMSQRELELLSMAVRVGLEVSEDFDLERDFAEYWGMCDPSRLQAGYLPPMSDANDRNALEILTATGLLHATASDAVGKRSSLLGHVRIEKDGVVAQMIGLLEAEIAG